VAPIRPESLPALVAAQLQDACDWPDELREGLLEGIRTRYGKGVTAILIYGSYLRGKRDTLLDFYVLLEDYPAMRSRWQAALAWVLSPNVYQVQFGQAPNEARAKYALMTLGRFGYAMQRDFHSYFWARFAQPSGLLYCRDGETRDRLVQAVCRACSTFVARTVPCLPDRFTARDLVSKGLSMTYACELRSEPPGHAEALYAHNPAWYDSMVGFLSASGLGYRGGEKAGEYVNETAAGVRRRTALAWALRRVHGKVLSVQRLLKAALTFDGGFDYLLWKIGRHSGIRITPTERQRRFPLIFGWPVLWQLYRRGAFR